MTTRFIKALYYHRFKQAFLWMRLFHNPYRRAFRVWRNLPGKTSAVTESFDIATAI